MPPVTRLAWCASRVSQGTASRTPGYAVPDAVGIAASATEEATSVSVTRDARSSVACRRALPSVRGTQQPSGVNGLRPFNITAHYSKSGHSLRCAAFGAPTAARPAGSHNGRLCLAPLPSAVCAALPHTLNCKSVCSRKKAAPAHSSGHALRAAVVVHETARYAREQPDSPLRHHCKKLPPLPRSG